ncbi:hypothetical protein CDAR_612031 [Caerostris darwini]|uniref:Uncharacterized protein n=1 Tax=Caerostris darwini TaxID=1538125 RepID=A0AAV4MSZ0_9ARAC|nr:hypothetical protein CDAR_612031 [Caerostris darwini]
MTKHGGWLRFDIFRSLSTRCRFHDDPEEEPPKSIPFIANMSYYHSKRDLCSPLIAITPSNRIAVHESRKRAPEVLHSPLFNKSESAGDELLCCFVWASCGGVDFFYVLLSWMFVGLFEAGFS